jgi:hypothetical protein
VLRSDAFVLLADANNGVNEVVFWVVLDGGSLFANSACSARIRMTNLEQQAPQDRSGLLAPVYCGCFMQMILLLDIK